MFDLYPKEEITYETHGITFTFLLLFLSCPHSNGTFGMNSFLILLNGDHFLLFSFLAKDVCYVWPGA